MISTTFLDYFYVCGIYIYHYYYVLAQDSCALLNICPPSNDSTPPYFINCPKNISVEADEGSQSKVVIWTEPQANDTVDGPVAVHKLSSQNPGDTFQGKTVISYSAHDSSGNMAICSFTITVKVPRCSFFLSYGVIRECNHYDRRIGTRCIFDCYRGYFLNGRRQLECQEDGKWNDDFPTCEEIQCPPFPPSNGNFNYTCTKEFRFESECSLICPPGFDIPLGQGRVKRCRDNGMWLGSFPSCLDILKPEIKNCTPLAYGTADENSTTGEIYWNEPYVYDNADKTIVLQKNGTISPGDKIEAGTHFVTYTAVDQTGNIAIPCTVTLSIRVLTCQHLYDNNLLSVNCPWGNRYGAQCYFSCRIGSELIGPNITTCVKSKDGNYAYWDLNQTKPYCVANRSCDNSPSPPKNGFVVCDTWLDGKFCLVRCHDGYNFKSGYPSYQMLICLNHGQDSGRWLPENAVPIPDCSSNSCPNVTVPKNGALVCNGWKTELNRFCVIFCQLGTQLSPGHDIRTRYVCGGSGQWLPTGNLPSCELSHVTASPKDIWYYFRVCDTNDKFKMKKNYLWLLQNSTFGFLCNNYKDLCLMENVDVQC